MRRRAELINRVRDFFRGHDVLEVDTPILQGGANLDPGVTPFRIETDDGPRFLPTSPEHPLKRLVAAGSGAVWTLSPAFRRGERGARHGPEFRMLEWYRPGWDDRRLLDEVILLLNALTGRGIPCETLTYRQAFLRHAQVDPVSASEAAILHAIGDGCEAVRRDRLAALDLLLATRVEPHLGRDRWTAIIDYPPHVAAQARMRRNEDGLMVAARFEVYGDGIELANGYWELSDAAELSQRLAVELHQRPDRAGLMRDRHFEAAIIAGLPDCAGVAVGFDRVVMLALGATSIDAVLPFAWDRA